MSTLLKPVYVRDQLLQKHLTVFTLLEFQRVFTKTLPRAKYFLETYTDHGLFIRLKNGLYALKDNLRSEETLANLLYRPSYISFEYALATYNILPEMVYSVTSATTKPTRTFSIRQKPFLYFTVKKSAFTGYLPVKKGEQTILFAEPEKALVDYLYFVSLGKKSKNDRLHVTSLDKAKIRRYSSLYQRPGLNRLIKEVI